jgi:hypothetical protein
VVDDCVQRWFQDTLKEARRGDSAMQVLVAQMYNSGYGVPRNEQKVLHRAPLPLILSPSSIRRSADVFHAWSKCIWGFVVLVTSVLKVRRTRLFDVRDAICCLMLAA